MQISHVTEPGVLLGVNVYVPVVLPTPDVFWDEGGLDSSDQPGDSGYYWCLPGGAPTGPFETKAEAIKDAQEGE